MKYKKYTDEQFIEAVAKSTSIRQVLQKLGLSPQGGNYGTARRSVERLNLDTSHFTGQASNKGRKFGPKRPIEDYISNKHSIQSYKLRKRLIEENYFEAKCYQCGITEWNGQPAPLELEHIDGNHFNNNVDNLTILCPNCHAQTSTYRGKNKSKKA